MAAGTGIVGAAGAAGAAGRGTGWGPVNPWRWRRRPAHHRPAGLLRPQLIARARRRRVAAAVVQNPRVHGNLAPASGGGTGRVPVEPGPRPPVRPPAGPPRVPVPVVPEGGVDAVREPQGRPRHTLRAAAAPRRDQPRAVRAAARPAVAAAGHLEEPDPVPPVRPQFIGFHRPPGRDGRPAVPMAARPDPLGDPPEPRPNARRPNAAAFAPHWRATDATRARRGPDGFVDEDPDGFVAPPVPRPPQFSGFHRPPGRDPPADGPRDPFPGPVEPRPRVFCGFREPPRPQFSGLSRPPPRSPGPREPFPRDPGPVPPPPPVFLPRPPNSPPSSPRRPPRPVDDGLEVPAGLPPPGGTRPPGRFPPVGDDPRGPARDPVERDADGTVRERPPTRAVPAGETRDPGPERRGPPGARPAAPPARPRGRPTPPDLDPVPRERGPEPLPLPRLDPPRPVRVLHRLVLPRFVGTDPPVPMGPGRRRPPWPGSGRPLRSRRFCFARHRSHAHNSSATAARTAAIAMPHAP